MKPLQLVSHRNSNSMSDVSNSTHTDKHTHAESYFMQTFAVFLNVKVCCRVIRGSSPCTPPSNRHTHTHTQPSLTHCLSRAGLSPLQASAPGPLLKCIIVWAELVGSSESPAESHTQSLCSCMSHTQIVFALSHSQIALELESRRWALTYWSCLFCVSSSLKHGSCKDCLHANTWSFVFKVKRWYLTWEFLWACIHAVHSLISV